MAQSSLNPVGSLRLEAIDGATVKLQSGIGAMTFDLVSSAFK